jgi:Holliday junction resolvase RusA-like endonuclease
MDAIQIRVPLPPSTNNLFANANGGGRVKTAAYKNWLNTAGWEVKIQLGAFERTPLVSGPCSIDILAPIGRNRDADNAIKPVLDLLVHMQVIADDKWVDDLRIRRIEGKFGGPLVVTIT